jgi:hypothetical protein
MGLGFWGKASRRAYTAAGSFCLWLIETRGVPPPSPPCTAAPATSTWPMGHPSPSSSGLARLPRHPRDPPEGPRVAAPALQAARHLPAPVRPPGRRPDRRRQPSPRPAATSRAASAPSRTCAPSSPSSPSTASPSPSPRPRPVRSPRPRPPSPASTACRTSPTPSSRSRTSAAATSPSPAATSPPPTPPTPAPSPAAPPRPRSASCRSSARRRRPALAPHLLAYFDPFEPHPEHPHEAVLRPRRPADRRPPRPRRARRLPRGRQLLNVHTARPPAIHLEKALSPGPGEPPLPTPELLRGAGLMLLEACLRTRDYPRARAVLAELAADPTLGPLGSGGVASSSSATARTGGARRLMGASPDGDAGYGETAVR